MKTLYLMRHGETSFNTVQKTQGWCDSPLTDRELPKPVRPGSILSIRASVLIIPTALSWGVRLIP